MRKTLLDAARQAAIALAHASEKNPGLYDAAYQGLVYAITEEEKCTREFTVRFTIDVPSGHIKMDSCDE